MLQPYTTDTLPHAMTAESANDILARIWPEYDPNGVGIMANMMEGVLRRVEQEQGSSLLVQASWDELRDYVKCVEGTIVSQKDLSDLLSLLQNTPQSSAPVVETSFSENQEPFPESETDDRYNSSGTNLRPESPISESLHPRHHSSVHSRSRRPGIRKISLSESSQFRPYHSRASHGSLEGELDDSEYHISFSRDDSRGTHSGNSSISSNPSPKPGDPKEWVEGSFNHMSLREQSRTEYEGYGLEMDSTTSEDPESIKQAYLALQRKHKETERVLQYQDLALEQAREALDQQETEDLKRKVRELHRQISESNTQISEMSKQMETTERVNSTQKSSAAAYKKQKDDLEKENALIREDLRRKEEALNNRLETDEAAKRKITDEQHENNRLREQLAQQIAEKEEMARTLELVVSKNLRSAELAELNGSFANETENTSSIAYSLGYMDANVQGKNLMSELASADPVFGTGSEQAEGDNQGFDTTSSERARQLLHETSLLQSKLKRSSMLDLSQRFKESMETALSEETKEPVSVTSISTNQGEGSASAAVVIRHKADDVDCALPQGLQSLPQELQSLEDKEALLDQNLQSQDQLIDSLFHETESPLGASGIVIGGIIRPNTAFGNMQKTERARRRRPQQSRIVSPQDVVNLLNPGANTSSSTISKKDAKKAIANVTLVSVYTIVVYLLGLVTTVFMVDNQAGSFNTGRFLSYNAMGGAAGNNLNGAPNQYGVIELVVYWIQSLVWQGDGAHVPT